MHFDLAGKERASIAEGERAPVQTAAAPLSDLLWCPLARFVAHALRGFRLELPRLAGLHVMTPAAQLAKDARPLHLPLERLERPFDPIAFFEHNSGHATSLN
jgi:hypothetical protein